jgi:RecA/RadA recombinase
MRGGFREGQLTELVGESSSGKTQILMQAAAVTALRGEGVIFLDTTNSFSSERVLAMARAQERRDAAVGRLAQCHQMWLDRGFSYPEQSSGSRSRDLDPDAGGPVAWGLVGCGWSIKGGQ